MKLGVALSGGGVRGIAHAGALKALEENNIKIDIIGGTSSGSLVASLYAMGYSPYYIYMLFKRYAKDMVNINSASIVSGIKDFMISKRISLSGIKTGKTLEKAFNEIASRKKIKKMSDIYKIPIVIPTVDVKTSKEYIFTNIIPEKCEDESKYITNISIGKAIRASSSFPGIFCPCDFKNYKFLDGGILDNIPVTEVKKQGADRVIAINFKADDVTEKSNFMDITMRTIDIMGNKISEDSIEKCDFLLTISTDKTGLLDVEKGKKCFEYGYQAVIDELGNIKKILK